MNKTKKRDSRMGKHQPGKRQHTWWCFDHQWKAFGDIARKWGRNASGLLNGIADGEFEVKEVAK